MAVICSCKIESLGVYWLVVQEKNLESPGVNPLLVQQKSLLGLVKIIMRIRGIIIVALASGAVLLTGLLCRTAQAQETLADLASGGTLTVGDKIFSGFSYTDSGLTSFNPANIMVSATAVGNVDYLTWAGNISLASLGAFGATATADLQLNYIVTATGGNTINEIDQNYTGTVASGSATVGIAETAMTPGGNGAVVGSTYLNGTWTYEPNFSDVPVSLNSSQPFINPPQPVLDVTKNIGFSVEDLTPIPGFPGLYTGSVSVSQIQQSFHQVPEPTTMALLLPPFAATTLRLLRKRLKA